MFLNTFSSKIGFSGAVFSIAAVIQREVGYPSHPLLSKFLDGVARGKNSFMDGV